MATRNRNHLIGVMSVIAGLVPGQIDRAAAAPVIFGANAYELIIVANPFTGSNNTWATASAAAAASVFNSVNGHLATVTSQAENDFLVSLIGTSPQGFNGAWLGGNQFGWLEGPETGMTFAQAGGYTNWNPLEPNNSFFMYMSIGTSTPNSGAAGLGKWLDDSGVNGTPVAGVDPVVGYVVEYEKALKAVPEPNALALLAAGLVGLGASGLRRMRKAR